MSDSQISILDNCVNGGTSLWDGRPWSLGGPKDGYVASGRLERILRQLGWENVAQRIGFPPMLIGFWLPRGRKFQGTGAGLNTGLRMCDPWEKVIHVGVVWLTLPSLLRTRWVGREEVQILLKVEIRAFLNAEPSYHRDNWESREIGQQWASSHLSVELLPTTPHLPSKEEEGQSLLAASLCPSLL